MRQPRRTYGKGFTLVELVFVIGVIGIVGGYVIVNLPQQFARWRILSAAQQVSSVFQRARLEAVRRNEQATVEIIDNRAVATVGTALTFGITLEGGIEFGAPAGELKVDGFGADDKAIFRVDGTVQEAGAFRLSGARDYFMEVRIDPPATGRTVVLKWDPLASPPKFKAQGEGGEQWQWR